MGLGFWFWFGFGFGFGFGLGGGGGFGSTLRLRDAPDPNPRLFGLPPFLSSFTGLRRTKDVADASSAVLGRGLDPLGRPDLVILR